jgi:hypothetical protein
VFSQWNIPSDMLTMFQRYDESHPLIDPLRISLLGQNQKFWDWNPNLAVRCSLWGHGELSSVENLHGGIVSLERPRWWSWTSFPNPALSFSQNLWPKQDYHCTVNLVADVLLLMWIKKVLKTYRK